MDLEKHPMWNNIQTVASQIYYKSECVWSNV